MDKAEWTWSCSLNPTTCQYELASKQKDGGAVVWIGWTCSCSVNPNRCRIGNGAVVGADGVNLLPGPAHGVVVGAGGVDLLASKVGMVLLM